MLGFKKKELKIAESDVRDERDAIKIERRNPRHSEDCGGNR